MNNRKRLIIRVKRLKPVCRHKYDNGYLSLTIPDYNGYCKCLLCGETFKIYANIDKIKELLKYEQKS